MNTNIFCITKYGTTTTYDLITYFLKIKKTAKLTTIYYRILQPLAINLTLSVFYQLPRNLVITTGCKTCIIFHNINSYCYKPQLHYIWLWFAEQSLTCSQAEPSWAELHLACSLLLPGRLPSQPACTVIQANTSNYHIQIFITTHFIRHTFSAPHFRTGLCNVHHWNAPQ